MPGDDHVADAGGVAVGEFDHRVRLVAVEPVNAGPLVEFGDKLPGGGEHDAVASGLPVGGPGVEQLVGHGLLITDADAVAIEVEAKCFGLAVAQRERRRALRRICEADEFGQP